MIRRTLVMSTAALFLALALPLAANAQSVYGLAGASFPSGDYDADTGWLAAAGVTVDVGEAGLWVGAEGLYGGNGRDDEDITFNPFSVMGIVGYSVPTASTVSPFVFGGAGLMGIKNGDSETGFGWQLGGGIAFAGESAVTPFVEGRYQSASIEDATLAFFGIDAGISIGFGN